MADWTERYRPDTLSEVRGNDSARDELREWAETWTDHRKCVICHGSPGVGKTSAAHALASDLGWSVMELNASDSRTRDIVERIAGEATKSGTLQGGSGGRRLVILDEADNFHGNADYGGARAVTAVVKEAEQPVVLIANEFYEMSRGLRNACREIEFRDVSSRSIVPVLRDICRKEGIEFEQESLEAIADQTSGDLRSAINDLQALTEGRDRLVEADVVTSERDTSTGIFDFLDDLFKEHGAQEALHDSYDVDETPDELLSWIEDNVPKEYQGAELADAFQHLSTADRWLGRVRSTQNYSFWRYASDAMVAGVAASRQKHKGGWTRYGPPSFRTKLGRSKSSRNTRDAIARRIAEREGMSISTARRVVLPFLGTMIHHCKPRELSISVAAAYELDADELAFVTGSGTDTNKVASIVETAEERRESQAVEGSQGAFEGTIEQDEDVAPRDEETGSEKPGETNRDRGGEHTDTHGSATSDDDSEDSDDPDTNDSQSGLDEFV
jgi:replication factor C large subunit